MCLAMGEVISCIIDGIFYGYQELMLVWNWEL